MVICPFYQPIFSGVQDVIFFSFLSESIFIFHKLLKFFQNILTSSQHMNIIL